MVTQYISFATRTLFNALVNGDRGTEAPWPQDGVAVSVEARAMLTNGGPAPLAQAPAATIVVHVVPQAGDYVHASNMLRMLPAWSPESTSGGWVANPYSIDPAPLVPGIIVPPAQWQRELGEIRLRGLDSFQGPAAIFEPGLEVTTTGAM